MDQRTRAFVDKLVSRMTLEQKVGQCLVIGFCGTVLTPEILKRIRRYYPAGVRAGLTFRVKTAVHDPTAVGDGAYAARVVRNPRGAVKDYLPGVPVPHCTNEEYCALINRLKREALDNGLGIPLHVTMDMEGDASADYSRGGIHYFPSPMGISLAGETSRARDIAWAVGRQLKPLGCDWLHSPVLDVNSNPMNPEIGTRSYGEDPATAARFALEAFHGFRAAGIIATGKHFPGRGASAVDSHGGLPVIDVPRPEMEQQLLPFRRLVEAGIPAIMTAHTAYPCLDGSGAAATLSKPIITDLLKGEMGFQGVVATDDMTMGGIVQQHEVAEACCLALNAGADLVLVRDESPLIDEIVEGLLKAVRKGELKEERLEDAVRRTLLVKHEYGLFRAGSLRNASRAGEGIADRKVARIAREAAGSCVRVLRDESGLLPLKAGQKVLLVEQINPLHRMTNSQVCHPGMLWEHLLRVSGQVAMVEVDLRPGAPDYERIRDRVREADIILATDYYYRNQKRDASYGKELMRLGKPLLVVTNSHYPTAVRPEYRTVVVTYGVGPESMAAVADKLYGLS